MYAIIEASGKQYRAEPDAVLRIPRLPAEPGDTLTFDVLLAETDGGIQVGRPSLDGATVEAEVVRHGRGEKIIVFKRKRRKNYRRKQGHRQDFTEIRVTGISVGEAKPEPAARKPKREPARPAKKEPPVAEVAAAEPTAADVEVSAAAAEVDVTEAARKLAEEHGIDLGGITGSGAGGRILKGDVERAIRDRAEEE